MSDTRNKFARTPAYRVGIDVGGTFTDVIMVEEGTGRILGVKVDTVPRDPSEGCLAGLTKALSEFGIAAAQISFIVHGTTIATNTIIEGKGARAGLITSEGFSDVLEIAYQTRPTLYDPDYRKTPPLIPRHRCIGVPERIDRDGKVLVPLSREALRQAARDLVAEKVQAIVVAFLHAYKDPTHEREARGVLQAECGALPIVLSSDVCPEFREYPRTSTAVVNAVLLPVVGPYIARLQERMRELGITAELHLMTSAGGIMTAELAKGFPVHLVESGPAAGVIGATFVAGLAGYSNVLALDIGGTTAKAALITNGNPRIADQFEVGASAVAGATAPRGQGYPVLTPVISLVEIGAGGGSIAHIDPGGALKVGPQSAGAEPGPVCYGRGGKAPTITDANLVLGRINPDFFLGAAAKLQPGLAVEAVNRLIAEPMDMSVQEAALAIIEIANAKMASALHFVSVEQGIDPRDYMLVPSGGAGPMLAAEIASKLGVRRVLVPPTPGLNSAVGLLATDLRHELVRTCMRRAEFDELRDIHAVIAEMETACAALLRKEGVASGRVNIAKVLDVCYVGQSYQLKLPAPDSFGAESVAALKEAFHSRHADAYGFANEAEPILIVNVRVVGTGVVERPTLSRLARAEGPVSLALKGQREVYYRTHRWVPTPLYDRTLLREGHEFVGPAIVEQMDTTTVVPPGVVARVEAYGNLILETA